MTIDRDSMLPLYYQVREDIRGKILSQEWDEGFEIPTEKNLIDYYGVSRQTIRQALGALVEEGLIVRQKGRGSFVSSKKLPDYFLGDVHFTKQVMENKIVPGSSLVFAGNEVPNRIVLENMNLKNNTPVFRIDRVRKAANVPMVLEKLFVHPDFDDGLENEELVGLWVMKFIEKRNNIIFSSIDSEIRSVIPDKFEKEALGISEDNPVLKLENKVFYKNKIVIYSERIMKGANFSYKVKFVFGKGGILCPEMIFRP